MTEDDLFAQRPMGMRMAMVVRQWRAIIDSAITDTGLTQSSWTVLMQLHQLGENVSVSELAEVQGIELPPLMRTITQLEKQGYLLRSTSPYDKRIRLLTLTAEGRAQVLQMARERHPGKTIELQESVDPSLIGGLVLRIGDQQVDASVSRRLSDLRRKFSENPYIPEI